MPDFHPETVATVLRFVRAVNRHDVEAVASLMTANHEFMDSLGTCIRGRNAMRSGWLDYFKFIPDYHMEVTRTLREGNTVVLLGFASGTCAVGGKLCSKYSWRIPAAWSAEVRNNRLARWQVYADNKPVHDIVATMTQGAP